MGSSENRIFWPTGMPATRSYVVDVHMPSKPASVKIGGREVKAFELPAGGGRGGNRAERDKARAAFDAATEGWLFDPADRRGVLHIRVGPQALAKGYAVTVGL